MTKLIEIITYGDDCVLHGACIDGMPMVRAEELCALIHPWAREEWSESQFFSEVIHNQGCCYRLIPKEQLGLDGGGIVCFLGFKEAIDKVMQSVVRCSERGQSWEAVLSDAIKESYEIKAHISNYATKALNGEYVGVDMAGRKRKIWLKNKLCRMIFGKVKNG